VSIEGNIGSGKSTLMDQLRAERADWVFIDEPVSLWSSLRNEDGDSLLQLFYKDRTRWSYTFQNCALLTRFQNIETAIAAFRLSAAAPGPDPVAEGRRQVFITERCLDTDFQVSTAHACRGLCVLSLLCPVLRAGAGVSATY